MMQTKYKAGIIGCGRISNAHSSGYKSLESVEIVACADVKGEAAKSLAEKFSILRTYTDYKEMLKQEELDIVSVCTWPGFHAEAVITAAESGAKGILCEKPMCLSLKEADEMISACEKNNTKLVIGHQHRYNPLWTEVRRLIKEGVIGQPTLVYRRMSDSLLDNSTHAIDGVRYILSDPETEWVIGQVERNTDRYMHRHRIEDRCAGIICFVGGTRGIIESDLPGPNVPAAFVYGTEGMFQTGESGVFGRSGMLLLNNKTAGWQEVKPAQETSSPYADLVAWMEGRIESHRSEGKQARYTMEIMMAIYESLRIKGVVKMPLESRESPLETVIDDGTLPVLEPGKYDIRTPF